MPITHIVSDISEKINTNKKNRFLYISLFVSVPHAFIVYLFIHRSFDRQFLDIDYLYEIIDFSIAIIFFHKTIKIHKKVS